MNSQKEATLHWQGGMAFTATNPAAHQIDLDASPEHGGSGAAPQPTELLLMALGGCTAMDVISILTKKRQQVTAFEVRVSGIRRDEHPRIFTAITITYLVSGHGVDPAAVARAIELSATKYCPVQAMLAPTVAITSTFEIHEAPPA